MRQNYRMSHFIIWWFNTDILPAKKFSTFRVSPLSDVSKSIGTVTSQVFLSDQLCPVALIKCSYVAQWLSIAQKVVGSSPREHTCNTQKCIKVSAKCINVNAIIQILKAGNLSCQLFITHTNQDEDEGADEGVIDNPPGFPYTPPGVDVLEEGKLTSNNVAGSSHDPLQSFAVASGAVSKPGDDAARQDALHSAGVEGSEDARARSKLPQPSQEEEMLMCLLQHCVCVSRPCEILGDVNTEELKAVYPLHRYLVDGDGCVFSALSPEIQERWQVVLLTPFSQGTHLLSVGRLIVVGDQAYHRCVICKFDDDVGAVCGCTVVCVQGVQEWAEDAALRSTSVEDQGRWGVVAHSDHLTSACQEVQDPAAQRSVQSQSLELRNQCGRHVDYNPRTAFSHRCSKFSRWERAVCRVKAIASSVKWLNIKY